MEEETQEPFYISTVIKNMGENENNKKKKCSCPSPKVENVN